jgi:hypothetical protein
MSNDASSYFIYYDALKIMPKVFFTQKSYFDPFVYPIYLENTLDSLINLFMALKNHPRT